MNNQGQVVVFTFMVGLVVILLALALSGPTRTSLADVSTNIGCFNPDLSKNTSLSNFDQATCIIVDLTIFHFIIGLVVLGGAVIAARRFV